jgi:hypothetical protein
MLNLFRHPTGQVADFVYRILSEWDPETSSGLDTIITQP